MLENEPKVFGEDNSLNVKEIQSGRDKDKSDQFFDSFLLPESADTIQSSFDSTGAKLTDLAPPLSTAMNSPFPIDFDVREILDWSNDQILEAWANVAGSVDGGAEWISDNTSSRIAGLYFEIGAAGSPIPGLGIGGEGVVYIGVDQVTGQRVLAHYGGAVATAGVGTPVNLGVGAFAFTGAPHSFGGPSVGQQMSAGISGGASFTLDGEALAFIGLNSSASATLAAGYTFRVQVDGEVIYFFGDRQLPRMDSLQSMYDYFSGERLQGNTATTYELVADGVYLVQEIQFIPGGAFGQGGIGVQMYLVDETGQRYAGPNAEALLAQYGDGDANTWNFLFDGIGSYSYSGFWVPMDAAGEYLLDPQHCFLAGTQISMADGSFVPIECIEVGDTVMSYSKTGELVPGKVTQLYRNDVKCVLDVHGMMITPGHSTLCADGDAKGRHIPIIDIILSDGALMLENGTCIRASTGEAVGSKLDQFVNLHCAENLSDLNAGQFCDGRARLGTKLINASGEAVNIWQMLSQNGFDYDVNSENIISPSGQIGPMKFIGSPPKPEDYILAKSGLTLASIYSAGEWTETPQVNTGNFSAVVPAASN